MYLKNSTGRDIELSIREEEIEVISMGQIIEYNPIDTLPHFYKLDGKFSYPNNRIYWYFTKTNEVEATQTIVFSVKIIERKSFGYSNIYALKGFTGWRACYFDNIEGECFVYVCAAEGNAFEFILNNQELDTLP